MSTATRQELLSLRVQAIRYQARGIRSYELRPIDGSVLPGFAPGAHVDLHLANGLVRSYSICNSAVERHRYVIGVQRDPVSRGGSAFIHDCVGVGDVLEVAAPRNNFELVAGAAPVVLMGGGIGITPLLGMARSVTDQGRRWDLHYAVRTRQQLAFLEELAELESRARGLGRVALHVDDEQRTVLDLAAVVAGAAAGSQLYCCGPPPMLDAFERATSAIPDERCHVEHFTNTETPHTEGGYEVELAASGMLLTVSEGQTILDAVEKAGVQVDFSCTEGVCGTCQTRVLHGVPDHRDQVLTDREKASNEVMMICCSGSSSPRLVLDL